MNIFPCLRVNQIPQELPSILSAKDEKKWVDFGFPQQFVASHPDCVRFLIDSSLIFTLAMFRNGHKGSVVIKAGLDGHPLIKMDGQWTRWEVISKTIEYDAKQDSLVARGDPSIGYNYVFPEGIVQKHCATYDKLYPVDELPKGRLKDLRAHAKQFWKTNEEVDPDKRKECVLQVVTTRRDVCKRNWLTENLLDNIPEHVFLRLIDKKGKVYSFGMRMPPSEVSHVFAKVPFTYLTTAAANIATPDFEEKRKFDERRVTSIPITTDRKNEILDYVNQTNGKGMCFNYAKQNCNKLAQVVLGLAGVKVNTRLTFSKLLGRLLPSPSRLPIVGFAFRLADKVASIARFVFASIVKRIPEPVLRVFSHVKQVVLFMPRGITTLFNNTLAYILGGAKKTEGVVHVVESEPHMDDTRLTMFPRLFNNLADFFKHEKSHSYFSPLMVEWQLKQPSTRIYAYDKSLMYI